MMRALETLPAITSWVLLTSPIWASFFIPVIVAYYIILFDLYFFIRSASLGINAVRGYIKIQQTIKMDWENKLKAYSTDIEHVRHVIFIPTYKEPTEILQRTLSFLSEQEFPAKQINICLATEEREKGVSKKAEELRKQFDSNLNEDWGCGGGGYSFIIESLTEEEYLKLDCSNLTSLLIRNNWKKKFEGKFDYSIYKWGKLYILITGFPNSIG